jgi:hypothetical protein
MLNGFKQVHIQPFMTHRAIELRYIGILRRLSGLNIEHRNTLLIGLINQSLGDILWHIVTTNGQGFTTRFNDLIQRPDDSLGW